MIRDQATHRRRFSTASAAIIAAIAGLAIPSAQAASAPTTTRSASVTKLPKPAPTTQIIVKIELELGYTINNVISSVPIEVDNGGLSSRGIYLVSPTSEADRSDPKKIKALVDALRRAPGVVYAQTNDPIRVADDRFYGWPYGSPSPIGDIPAAFVHQRAARYLRLDAAHELSIGSDTIVAVLDTGVDADAPALAGRTLPGWNYVADSADTGDVGVIGAANTSVGHGTFISGLISLVAPGAVILPEKVLDSNGFGTIYGAAEAIENATAAGADVINLSFGAGRKPHWNLLADAIARAQRAGVVVVAASGNDGEDRQHFPAAQPKVLSVGALDEGATRLAQFSDYGKWVQVAAPGLQIVGPLPGGGYATWAGTSMAAPFVSGQAALIVSAQPGISAERVVSAISHTARKLAHSPVRFGSIDIANSLDYARLHR